MGFDKNGYVVLDTELINNPLFNDLINEFENAVNLELKNSNIKKLGGNAKAYKGNISNYDEIKNTIQMINNDFGEIDFLINNAGYTRIERFFESKPEEWDKQIDVCLKGSINC